MKNTVFNEGTKLEKIFTILSDCNWHCGKHELPGTQPAKAIQIIRQNGFDVINKTMYCEVCKDKTIHRKLTSSTPLKGSFTRLPLPQKLLSRVHSVYENIEAITMRKMISKQLEVDHRFPQVRWNKDEVFDKNMSDEELKNKFQLLTREHNLWKSRYCENCFKTNKRGTFIGIQYFAEGGQEWDSTIPPNDESGCRGCFWYDPNFWRDSLNKKLNIK